jgi:hypothetical protein
MRGPHHHKGAHFRRAMHARRWMREHPTNEEITTMLEEYQRDLEEEVANVADRIRRLRQEMADA